MELEELEAENEPDVVLREGPGTAGDSELIAGRVALIGRV